MSWPFTTVALKFELHEEFPAMPEFSMFDVPAIFPDEEVPLPDSNGENSLCVHPCPLPLFEWFLQLGHEKVVSITELGFDMLWHRFFFHRPLSKHWKSTRLWRTSTCHGIALAMKEHRPGCIWSFYIQICQFQLKRDSILLDTCMESYGIVSLALQVAKKNSLPLPSCFHPMSEILGRSTGPTAEHLSNITN